MNKLSLSLVALLLVSCTTMKDIPTSDPSWIYGEGEGESQAQAEQSARLDLLGRALQEGGGAFAIDESWKASADSSKAGAKEWSELLQARLVELPVLKPLSSAKTKAASWRTIYRLSRKEWAAIEARHRGEVLSKLTQDWGIASGEGSGAAVYVDRVAAFLRLGSRLQAEGWVDAAIEEAGISSLKAESEKLLLGLSAEIQIKALGALPLAIEGKTIDVQVIDSKASIVGLKGIPLALRISLKPGKGGRLIRAVTDEAGKASFAISATSEEAGRIWFCTLATDFASIGPGNLALALDSKTSSSSQWRHLASLSILLPPEIAVAAGQYPVGKAANDRATEPDEAEASMAATPGFMVQESAVSMEAWRVYQDLNPGSDSENSWLDNEAFNAPDQPVVGVTWRQAQAYALWLSKLGGVYRLPTEVERDIFARAGGKGVYPWGDQAPGPSLAQFRAPGVLATAKLRSFAQGKNPWGLWDASGNIWEWTSSDAATVLGARQGWKAVKGGAWNCEANDLRLSNRRGMDPSSSRSDLGFRLVREMTP